MIKRTIDSLFNEKIMEFQLNAIKYLQEECNQIAIEEYNDEAVCQIYRNKNTERLVFLLRLKNESGKLFYFAEIDPDEYKECIEEEEKEVRENFANDNPPKTEEWIKSTAKGNALEILMELNCPEYCVRPHY